MSPTTTTDHHQHSHRSTRNRDFTQEYFQRSLESVSDRLTRNRRFSLAGDRSTLPSSPYSSSNEPVPPAPSSSFDDSSFENNETVEAATLLLGLGSSNSSISFSTSTPTTTMTDSKMIYHPTSLLNDPVHHSPSISTKDPGMVIEDMINASIHLSSHDYPRTSTQTFDCILHDTDDDRHPLPHKRPKLLIHDEDLTSKVNKLDHYHHYHHHHHQHLDRHPTRTTHRHHHHDDRPTVDLNHGHHHPTKPTDHHHQLGVHHDLAIQHHPPLQHSHQLGYYPPAPTHHSNAEEEGKLKTKTKKKKKRKSDP